TWRIPPSNVAATCSASRIFSIGCRLGAYTSGPVFSGTAPSRSLLLMVTSYKAQCKLRGSVCRLIAACDLGGRGAERGRPAEQAAPGRLCTTFSRIRGPEGLPMELKTRADAYC